MYREIAKYKIYLAMLMRHNYTDSKLSDLVFMQVEK